jgi:hypothetical protein
MGIYCDIISDVSLGTSTAKTELSGDRTGNAANYTLSASCKGILSVQPYLYIVTPTANQTLIVSLKVESDDLGIKDFEVLAPPGMATVSTPSPSMSDLMRTAEYPLYFSSLGGETVQFYGIPQVANTAAPYMGAMIKWTDDPTQLTQPQFRARIGGTAGAAGSATSTGTSATAVTGATIAIGSSGVRNIRAVTGILANTTLAAVKPIAGWFSITAPELAYTLRYAAEPVQGPLAATMPPTQHLTRVDQMNAACNTPTTLQTGLQLTAAPSTAGNFAQGILYN